jgi:fluoride ion exporter CrcB/FEX
MSPVERRTRILVASALATIFIGYFIYSYAADAATGSWVALGIDGVLLALGTYCAFQAIRGVWSLFMHRSDEIPHPIKNRENIDFRS